MKAIDIVLLFPEEIEQEFIEIHQSLQSNTQEIDFIRDGSLPHISLCMLILNDDELNEVINMTNEITKNHQPIRIINEKLHTYTLQGKIFTEVLHTKTPELYDLHKDLMNEYTKFSGRTSHTSMFYNSSEVDSISCTWVDGYFTNSAYDHFNPHTTLGAGVPTLELKNKECITPRLAVSHFGNYCTVRDIFAEFSLGD